MIPYTFLSDMNNFTKFLLHDMNFYTLSSEEVRSSIATVLCKIM